MIAPVAANHVSTAIHQIGVSGADSRRASTKFCLVVDGRHYPPKHVLSLAVQEARGTPLKPQDFSGGDETNSILRRLGFTIVSCHCGGQSGSVPLIRATGTRGPGATAGHSIARLVVNGAAPGRPQSARDMLLHVLRHEWPAQARAKFLVTPGGFVSSRYSGLWPTRTSWMSQSVDTRGLVNEAARVLEGVVTRRVLAAALGKVDVLTIGVDLCDAEDMAHIELVAVLDVRTGKVVRWTGKSYPTSYQERRLVQFADVETHLLRIAGERVLILGCHDLNMFSPRAWKNQDPRGARRKRCRAMLRSARDFAPTVVLQHPHNTDSPNIWRMPWMSLAKKLPSVEAWASGIAYNRPGSSRRASIARVLDLTQGGQPTLDITVRLSDFA